jgi:hypothetical protein
MRIFNSSLFFILVVFSFMSNAQVSESEKAKLLNKCISDGEEKAVCACATGQWLDSISPQETSSAKEMIALMTEQKQPSPQQMASLQALIMRYTQLGMSCASQNFEEEPEPSVDIESFIPKGALTADQAKAFNDLVNSDNTATTMENLKELDEIDKRNREAKRSKDRAERSKKAADIDKRLALYRTEKVRIENLSIIDTPVQDFNKLFTLHYRAKTSESEQTIKCLWNTVLDTAGEGSAASLMTYYVATGSSGDYDAVDSEKPYRSDASKRLDNFYQQRETCF